MINETCVDDAAKKAATLRNPMPSSPLLYHYSGRIDAESLLKIIAAELFYFSNPLHFNDALDMRMPIQPQKTDEISPYFSIIAGNEAQSVNAFDTQPPELIKFLSSMIGNIGTESIEELRVLCTTEHDDTPLMWSHYGNRHQGICFGLDWNHLRNRTHIPFKVHYQNEFSLTEHGAPRFQWEVSPLARTKTTDWAHENEWRFFRTVRNKDEVCFIPLRDALKTVTLGCQVSRETRKLVISLVNRYKPNVEIRQIDIVNGQFQSNVLSMPENFNGLSAELANNAIYDELEACLHSGHTDAFLCASIPYFFHLEALDEKLASAWMPIIAAASLTRNEVLKNRVVQWCAETLIVRAKHTHAVDFNKASDAIDIWSAYLSYIKPTQQHDLATIVGLNLVDDKRPMSLENRRLFLRIGYKLARIIETKRESLLHQNLLPLCENNLKMAQKLNEKNGDVGACISMLANLTPTA